MARNQSILVCLLLLGLGCGDSGPAIDPPLDMVDMSNVVRAITANFENLRMAEGFSIRARIQLDGEMLPPSSYTLVTDSETLSIEDGVLFGQTPGSAQVIVQYEGIDYPFDLEIVEPVYTSLATGLATSCGLATDKTVTCWGSAVAGTSTLQGQEFDEVVVEGNLACGRAGSQVWCWGYTNGHTYPGNYDIGVAGRLNIEPVLDIDANDLNVCALLESGSIQCFGSEGYGQVRTVEGPFVSMSVGQVTVCGLKADSSRTCWGYLGSLIVDEPEGFATEPIEADGDVAFVELLTGATNACGITAERELYCWGTPQTAFFARSFSGRPSEPVLVMEDVKQASLRAYTICAINSYGEMRCFGQAGVGEIPGISASQSNEPVLVEGLWESVSMGNKFGCALSLAGERYCWGADEGGALSGRKTLRPSELSTPATLSNVESLALDESSICYIESGALYCMGVSRQGSAGIGPKSSPEAIRVLGDAEAVTKVQLEHDHGCALTAGGAMYAWGPNGTGVASPVRGAVIEPQLVELPSSAIDMSCNGYHACAVLDDFSLHCWGANNFGQVDPSSQAGNVLAQEVSFMDEGFPAEIRLVEVSPLGTCAVTRRNNVYCWGLDTRGQNTGREFIPKSVPSVKHLLTDEFGHCVQTEEDQLYCWGSHGTIGSLEPQLLDEFIFQAANTFGSLCKLDPDGVRCIGNTREVVAPPSTTNEWIDVHDVEGAVALYGKQYNLCVVDRDGQAHCWGYDYMGLYAAEQWLFDAPTQFE